MIPHIIYSSEITILDRYHSLLNRFPIDRQGFGLDPYSGKDLGVDQAETYGLLLLAETAHYKWDRNLESSERINNAVEWLINNVQKEDRKFIGWGLADSWDAFSDGTVNPPHHVYTIINSIILLGLLDYLTIPEYQESNRARRVMKIIRHVTLSTCKNTWTDDGQNSHFWYSVSPNDAPFVVNVSAMMAGTLSRILKEQPLLLNEQETDLVECAVDKSVEAIISKTRFRNNIPFWNYIEKSDEDTKDSPNDLVHHIYIVYGLELYRSNRGKSSLPWTTGQSIESLDQFWRGGQLFDYPQDVDYIGENESFNTRPPKLWGAGAMAVFYSQGGDQEKATRCLDFIYDNYGVWPDIRLWPVSFSGDTNFYPRYTSHVLWALSEFCFPKTNSVHQ